MRFDEHLRVKNIYPIFMRTGKKDNTFQKHFYAMG